MHLRRPDKVGYVIDSMPDYPTAVEEDGVPRTIMTSQIWVSAKQPNKWRHDRKLMQWIEATGRPAIVRVGNRSATMVVPPAIMKDKEWGFLPVQLTRPDELSWADETVDHRTAETTQRAGPSDAAAARAQGSPSPQRVARLSQRVK